MLWAPSSRTSGRRPDRFEPAFPARLPDGPEDLRPVERPPDPRQDLGRGDGHGRVRALVAAGETGREHVAPLLPFVDEPVAAACPPGFERPAAAKDLDERGLPLAGDAPDHPQGRPALTPQTTGTPGLDDARFFEGDLLQRRAEMLLVVLGDRGDDRDERPDDVGRVEPPAHAHFEDGDVDLALGELDEGQGGHDLEVGRVVDELALGHGAGR